MPDPADPAADPAAGFAARILHDARWMVGLTQAEVAQRAGVTRQVVSQYEQGSRQPSVETLDRLLAGCGMRLRLSAVPEPGLEDEPTRDLLKLPPIKRISSSQASALRLLAHACPACPTLDAMIVGGKVGARLHGACIRVNEVEIWFNDDQPVSEIAAILTAAGAEYLDRYAVSRAVHLTPSRLMEGCFLQLGDVELRILAVPHYAGRLKRAVTMALNPDGPGAATHRLITVADPGDCASGWYPRDRDHLALQRAGRLVAEDA